MGPFCNREEHACRVRRVIVSMNMYLLFLNPFFTVRTTSRAGLPPMVRHPSPLEWKSPLGKKPHGVYRHPLHAKNGHPGARLRPTRGHTAPVSRQVKVQGGKRTRDFNSNSCRREHQLQLSPAAASSRIKRPCPSDNPIGERTQQHQHHDKDKSILPQRVRAIGFRFGDAPTTRRCCL
jgi:hypothetical protein